MTVTQSAEHGSMAKTQKTLFFNDEMCQLVQAYADKTGTSFSKVMTAAVLGYFFGAEHGPEPQLISQTVALEKGKLTLAEVPVRLREKRAEEIKTAIGHQKKLGPDDSEARAFQERLWSAEGYANQWRADIERAGGGLKGVIAAAIEVVPQRRPGLPPSEPDHKPKDP